MDNGVRPLYYEARGFALSWALLCSISVACGGIFEGTSTKNHILKIEHVVALRGGDMNSLFILAFKSGDTPAECMLQLFYPMREVYHFGLQASMPWVQRISCFPGSNPLSER